jgi:hypothetical protein
MVTICLGGVVRMRWRTGRCWQGWKRLLSYDAPSRDIFSTAFVFSVDSGFQGLAINVGAIALSTVARLRNHQ